MSQRTLPGLAIFLLLMTFGAEGAAAEGKVGYRGQGRYAGAKRPPVAPTATATMSSQNTPGPGVRYGVPPTDYRVDPYASLGGGTARRPHSHPDGPYGGHHDGGPYVIPYYVPIYLPTQPTVYEPPRDEAVYYDPRPEERRAPAPVVVVVQAPGGSSPAVAETLEARPPAAVTPEPLPHPTTPEPPPTPARPGRIELTVHPPEAAIYLDDRYLGTAAEVTAKGGSLRVDSGVHVLQVLHPAHKPERMVFGVASEGSVKVEVDLSGQRLIRRSHFETLSNTPPLVEFDS